MSRALIVSIPQELGRQEARRRLDSGISRLQPELSAIPQRARLPLGERHPAFYRIGNVATNNWPDRGARRHSAHRDRPAVGHAASRRHRRKTRTQPRYRTTPGAAGPRLRKLFYSAFLRSIRVSDYVNGRSRELKPRTRRDFAGVRDGSRRRFAQLYLPLLKTHPFPVSSLGSVIPPERDVSRPLEPRSCVT